MPFTRGRALRDATTPWDVRQLHDDPDAAVTRAAVLDDLEHGVTSVWVHVGDDGIAVADLPEVLADVRLDLAPVVVSSVTDQPGAARALLDLVADRESVGRQPRPRPVRRGRPARHHPRPRPARRPRARVRPPRRLARHHRRRPRAARGRRHRRRRPRGRRRHRRRVPAPPRGGRHPGERGVRPDRPAGRRHGRPVPHRRRAAGGPPGVGPGRRGLRRRRGPARRAHPRRHQPADVHPRGPLGQRAAQHPGRVRRLGGWRRLDHRAALRHRARPARAAGPPARAQHPDPARRRVQRRPGHRPRRRLLVPRVPDRPGGGCRVVPLPGGRARRRCRAGPRRRAAARLGRAGVRRARPRARHPPPPAHRGVDVPRTGRRRPPPAGRAPPLTGGRARPRTPPRLDGVREAARPGHDRGRPQRRRAHAGHPARVRRPAGLRHQPARRRPASAPTDAGSPVAVLASSPKGYAEHGAAAVAELRAAGVERVLVAGRASELGDAADQVDGEVHDGIDVVAFLSDLLDRLGAPPDPATAATTTTSTEGSR